jgi:GDSL-like Lipase/Acylhydrolase family/N-terminus of Esterase_SGNH_hydro-type
MRWLDFPNEQLPVFGLPWFRETTPEVWRLPARLKDVVREPVWNLALQPSGGRIRFATDATSVAIRLRYERHGRMHNMCTVGQMGVDLYADGRYWRTAFPTEAGDLEATYFAETPREQRQLTLYLPLYHPVKVRAVGVDDDATVGPPAPFAVPRPVVFYGSSITQGGCASRGGLSYQAILGRALNIDFVNLGLSGNGRGEPELARALAEIDAAAFVIDFAQNCPTVEELRERYAPFLRVIRDAHPRTPMVCITPILSVSELHSAAARDRLGAMRQVIRDAVAERRQGQDERITLVEGYDLLGPGGVEGFVDGSHPNDLGFQSMADGLMPVIRRVLGLQPA